MRASRAQTSRASALWVDAISSRYSCASARTSAGGRPRRWPSAVRPASSSSCTLPPAGERRDLGKALLQAADEELVVGDGGGVDVDADATATVVGEQRHHHGGPRRGTKRVDVEDARA